MPAILAGISSTGEDLSILVLRLVGLMRLAGFLARRLVLTLLLLALLALALLLLAFMLRLLWVAVLGVVHY
jgi:hypothetical protein